MGLVRGLLSADALREGRLVRLTRTSIPAHYNLYALWPHGGAEGRAHGRCDPRDGGADVRGDRVSTWKPDRE